MPLQKVGSKWRYGIKGKLYTSKALAVRQMRAMLASGYRPKKR
jgi:hypothetical protein